MLNKMGLKRKNVEIEENKKEEKFINCNEFLKFLEKANPDDYPAYCGIIKRYQIHKRKSFILDLIGLLNEYFQIGEFK